MKTKKALAVVLAVVMLVMPLAVSSFAATATITANPLKTTYNDNEYFNPQGLVVTVDGEEIAYSPADSDFRFIPALNELLTVETTEIVVYYKNAIVGVVNVTVNHILGDLVAINNGHGKYCLGCATLHEFEAHSVSNWVPNDDGGIFVLQTQTGKCDICEAEVTESIPGSNSFSSLFDKNEETGETEFSAPELMIYTLFEAIVVSLIQMLLGVN